MTAPGDRPFDPTERTFTVAEAARVSGVTEFDIRNWMRRDVVSVGSKNRLGRIMFSAVDIIYLRVMGDFNRLVKADPSSVAVVAEEVATHCVAWLQRDNKHLHRTEDGYRKETRLVFHLGEDGKSPKLEKFDWGETVFGIKVSDRGEGMEWTRHPFVILPIEQFFGDVLEELWVILESESD